MSCLFPTFFGSVLRAVAGAVFSGVLLVLGPAAADLAPSGAAPPGGAAPGGSYLLAFSDSATEAMVKRIRQGAAICERLPWAYRYDCLADTFQSAARLNGDKPDYRDARRILRDAGKKLDALVDRNIDTAQPKAKVGRKAYRAVKPSSRSAVSSSARAIVRDAEVQLLRSGGIQERQAHYQRIAEAVSATDLLLRAGLLRALPRYAGGWHGPVPVVRFRPGATDRAAA